MEVLLEEVMVPVGLLEVKQVWAGDLIEQKELPEEMHWMIQLMMMKKTLRTLLTSHVLLNLEEEFLPCHRFQCQLSYDSVEHSVLYQCCLYEPAYNEWLILVLCTTSCGRCDT